MSSTTNTVAGPGPEYHTHQFFTEVKSRQQRMWASGDYAAVAAQIAPVSERLVEAADLQAGWRVLDVATARVEGDAARLPVEAAGFDAVLSVFGVMFAPDQEQAASELVRACRPG